MLVSDTAPRAQPTRRALPAQPEGVPWPAGPWPTGAPGPPVDSAGLAILLDQAMTEPTGELGTTLAVVIVHRGRLVAERYGPGTGAETALLSWSMAKSITHALTGLVVGSGRLEPGARAEVPEWAADDDPRHPITVQQLLNMASGLAFSEDYVDAGVSDVIEMLFGAGQHDVAAFAAASPLVHPPGTVWDYSSGTTNIVSRLLGQIVGGGHEGMAAFINDELFVPLAMRSATATFDDAGTFVGSSYVHATAQDYARFALLYLRDGVWDGRRVLPEGWVDHARAPARGSDGTYGAHWWLHPEPPGTFYAAGYEGQYLFVVPALDLIVVRLGKTSADLRPALETWLHTVIACFG